MFKHFPKNKAGRDFVVGDVHGCFTQLEIALMEVNFNGEVDRLFMVGDLVDRGEESEEAVDWLALPWLHAVRGNHEQMAIDYHAGHARADWYLKNGGAWMVGKTKAEAQPYVDAFLALPIALDIDTDRGLIGIVHADCPVKIWGDLEVALNGENGEAFAEMAMWDRDRFDNRVMDDVEGVHMVIVGHTALQEPARLGNVMYIDTGAVYGRELTIVRIQ
jgi:serine/threonine protein phosphatase 1